MEKIGVYQGSFDTIHKGHIDVVNRALRFVDKLYIAVAERPQKNPLEWSRFRGSAQTYGALTGGGRKEPVLAGTARCDGERLLPPTLTAY